MDTHDRWLGAARTGSLFLSSHRRTGRIVAGFATLLFVGCGAEAPPAPVAQSSAIIGGTPIGPNDYPEVVGIKTSNCNGSCTATLISPTALLTAAHCVQEEFLKDQLKKAGKTPPDKCTFQVTSGNDMRDRSITWIETKGPEWDSSFDVNGPDLNSYPGHFYDIAIIHLNDPIAGPVAKLAPTDVVTSLKSGDSLLVTGYGRTVASDPMASFVLTKGTMKLQTVGQYEVVATNGPEHTCMGDSGGPIFSDTSDKYQLGIASRVRNSSCSGGAAYTRVDAYLSWIQQRVSDLGQELPLPPDGGAQDGGATDGAPAADAGAVDGAAPERDAAAPVDMSQTGGQDASQPGTGSNGSSGGCSLAPSGAGGDLAPLALALGALGWALRRRRSIGE